jgi:hypothetical protein
MSEELPAGFKRELWKSGKPFSQQEAINLIGVATTFDKSKKAFNVKQLRTQQTQSNMKRIL